MKNKPNLLITFWITALMVMGGTLTATAQTPLDSLTAKYGKYSGSYRAGLRHGRGTFVWPDGSKYVGQWRNDAMEGTGLFTAPDGTRYDGMWLAGKREGYGTYTWANGDKYLGEWRNGQKNGYGKLTMADRSSHEGEWKNDEADGQGTHVWATGTKYIGDWKRNQRDGEGVMIYQDGRIEQGNWKEDQYVPCECSKESQMPTEQMYQRADGVFVGKITGFQEISGIKLATVEVSQYWKGKLLQGRTAYVQVGMTSCDFIWFKNQEYLFFAAEKTNGVYVTNRCTRSERLERAGAELAALAALPCKLTNSKEDAALYNTNILDSSPVCGCDNVTYKSPNDARRAGARSWKAGKCQNQ
jgi:hypothetical protein